MVGRWFDTVVGFDFMEFALGHEDPCLNWNLNIQSNQKIYVQDKGDARIFTWRLQYESSSGSELLGKSA